MVKPDLSTYKYIPDDIRDEIFDEVGEFEMPLERNSMFNIDISRELEIIDDYCKKHNLVNNLEGETE